MRIILLQVVCNYLFTFRFGTFDHLKGHLAGADGQLSPLGRLGCGLGAGMAEATLGGDLGGDAQGEAHQ